MSDKTTTELADAVLYDLNVADAEETPDAVDRAFVIARYTSKFAELAAPGLELTYWTITAIPEPIFMTVVELMKNEVRETYGEPNPPEQKEGREMMILKRLRRHVSRPASGLRTTAEFF